MFKVFFLFFFGVAGSATQVFRPNIGQYAELFDTRRVDMMA